MPIPSTIADLSTTAGSNSPAGSESPTEGDNYIRALSAIIAQEHANLGTASSAAVGAGMLGLDDALVYGAGTVGAFTRREFSVFRHIPSSMHAAILAGTSTDDVYTYINEAIDAAIAVGGPVRVVFPTGKYRLDTALGSYEGANDLTIDFNGSTLDFSAVSLAAGGPLLGISGTYGTTTTLSSNAAEQAKTLAVTSSAAFSVGDMARVYSSELWDSTRTSTRIGEIVFIDTVPGGTSVTIVRGLQDAYQTADTATLQKLTPVRNVHIKNGTFIGPSGDDQLIGIRIKLGLECSIENMSTRDIDLVHIRLEDCVQSRVTGCYIFEANENSQAYGVSLRDACQDCQVTNNTMRDVRHAFTTNNGVSSSYGIIRRAIIAHNCVYNAVPDSTGGLTGDALDTHAGSDDIHFLYNIVCGSSAAGINFEGRSGTIRGNIIQDTTGNGIIFWNWSDSPGAISITNNVLTRIGDNTATNDYGIYVLTQAGQIDRAVVSNNTVRSKSAAIRVVGTVSKPVKRLVCSGNIAELRVDETLTSQDDVTVDLRYVARGTVNGNAVLGEGYGFFIENSTHLAITGNQVEVAQGPSTTRGLQANSCDRLTISANDFYCSHGSPTGTGVAFAGGTVTTNSAVRGNNIENFSTDVSLNAGAGSVETENL